MSAITGQFKKQFPRNSLFQLLSFGTQIVTGICLVPYLVRHLGTAAYGLIPIAGVLTQYVGLISQSISGSVNRFLTIALQKNDHEEANRIFSTAFYAYLGIGLVQIPFFALVISFAESLITIPDGLYSDAVVLLVCSAAAFIVNLLSGVFGVPMYAYNRLDLLRCFDICRCVARIAGIVVMFVALGPALRYVGYVDLSISLILCLCKVVVSRQLASWLKIRLRNFDWSKVKQLLGMGGWLLINTVGVLLFQRMDVWICNRFVSAEAAGEFAAVLQWAHLIRNGGAITAAVVAPMLTIYYAKSEIESIIRLCKVSVRMLSLASAIPISLLCIISPDILRLWLGQEYIRLAPLMVIMLFHLVINVGCMPLFNIQLALNKVRVPALVTLLMGALNLVLSIVFIRYLNLGVYAVALSGAVVLTSKNALFTPIYAARILQVKWYTFLRSYSSGIVLLAALVMLNYAFYKCVAPASLINLVIFSITVGIVGLGSMWFLLPAGDRQRIISMLPMYGTVYR